jgi:dipeptidyl aminopeptidase/acylaminoacyl peptidase
MKKFFFFLTGIGLLASCQQPVPNSKAQKPLIEKNNLALESKIMTPEVLWAFGRVSDAQVSPDGKKVVYGVSYYSVEQNKGNRELFVMNADGSGKMQLTKSPESEFNAVWHPNGEEIVFLSAKSGSVQAYAMSVAGEDVRQISVVEGGVSNLAFAPSGDKVFFTQNVKVDKTTADQHPDLPKADGKIIDDLMYRHWDTWEDGNYSHVFVADFVDGKIKNEKDIMPGEPFDSPLQPFGGIEEINWSFDGKYIAYTCKKLKGKAYTLSTNSDIYLYNTESGETKNMTEGMPGYDRSPFFSKDGKKLYWLSMERPGFEADKDRLFVQDLATGKKEYLTPNFDYSPAGIIWAEDSDKLYFIAGVESTHHIYSMNLTTNDIKAVTSGNYDYHSVALAGDKLIATRVDMTKPQEIYAIDRENGEAKELSFENKHLLDQLTMPTVEKRWVKTTDKKDMLVWVIYPPNFDKNKKYPAILYCQGGPQSPVSQFWSYRWNFSIMASNNYIVVAPARRGATTMGQEWTDGVSKDNAGQVMEDLLVAIDELKQEPFIDENRLGAVGASFGGFSVYWLAGNHNKRFGAFIAHCGVFNSEMEYMTTDEMFFDNWEKGGAPWETDNKVAQKSFAASPHQFVKNWDTPILVVHGEHDYRIPYTQGMAAFNSAQLMGVPSKLLFFPSETHWVLKPQNGILWQREFFNWLDTYLK